LARLDPHSYADSGQARARHLRLRLSVTVALQDGGIPYAYGGDRHL